MAKNSDSSFVNKFCEFYEFTIVLTGLFITFILGLIACSSIVAFLPILIINTIAFPFVYPFWFLGIAGIPTVIYFILKPTINK
jgi:hypothetical protein